MPLEGPAGPDQAGPGEGEAITSLRQPGETLGYRAYFGAGDHGGTAYAVTECRVCFFRSETVRELLGRNPALGFRFLERMAHDLEQADDTLIACLVGVRPESLSRGIRQLEAAGVAHFRGKRVVVPDLDALLDEIEGDEEAR